MEFDNSFEVPLQPADAWRVLMDIERIAPCVPGAQLTEKVDDSTYKGKVGVKLGPVALSFAGTARFEQVDDTNRTAQVKAAGTDAKGRGGANATVKFSVEAAGPGSKVLVHTDLALSGSVAQYGRGVGMIQEVASQLIKQFAGSLRGMIEAEGPRETAPAQAVAEPTVAAPIQPAPAAAKPISGFALMMKVLWASVKRLFSPKRAG